MIRRFVKRIDDYGKIFTKFCGPAFVGFASTLITVIAYTYFAVIFPATTSTEDLFYSINMLMDLSVSLFLTFNIYFNYYKAISVPAGYPTFPSVNVGIKCLIGDEADESLITSNIRWNFCKKCSKPKPPRTHHCSVCNRCILKMDHHCPWISGCVGYYNYRYFYLFLAYLWVSVIYVMIHAAPLFFGYSLYTTRYSQLDRILVIVSSIGSFVTFIAIGCFGGFHTIMIAKNETSIENLDRSKNKPSYHLGSIVANFNAVLGEGDYWFSGLLPTNQLPKGNGCYFKTNYIDEQDDENNSNNNDNNRSHTDEASINNNISNSNDDSLKH
ncbi:hypothetical protein DICPUDRAFT_35158 [Dictyostelium purpureum]|uniref:Palmitoyltransferase n=1 Tax=Dictyostelium purpureum TaxID=5786 RepID=F0ZNZ3_DICPU|nr:uncharacterized protein DICPUDRAFT_35158 [Dictyostelium purpureum]EGC34349.1 hypothetical protein DICPUDRAFT_35158 [Dictyostelium purpureum]|eukprot:XP_003289142.1 hypothetical protein DICPUDRAFT_35158 [Dictyostelium purpureum]